MATYGYRKAGGIRIPIPRFNAYCQRPAPPDKIYNDCSPRCLRCPYPRHGMMCRGNDNEECLRMEMQKLEKKWLKQREIKVCVQKNT